MATNFLSGRNARLCIPPQALIPGLWWSAHGAAANSGIWTYYTSQGLKKTKPKWLANMWSRRLIIPQVHICITSVQQEVCNVWGRISNVFRVQGSGLALSFRPEEHGCARVPCSCSSWNDTLWTYYVMLRVLGIYWYCLCVDVFQMLWLSVSRV